MHLSSFTIARQAPPVGAAVQIAADGFDQPVSAALARDVANHLAGGDLVYTLGTEDNQPFGFAIFNVWPHAAGPVLYLSGIILNSAHQHRGLARGVIAQARADAGHPPAYLALRTQSPFMWRTGAGLCDPWLPRPRPDAMSSGLEGIGHEVAGRIRSQFPVHPGCYGGPLYGRRPVHPDTRLQNWWDSLCSFTRGDAVVCIGRFK